VLDVGLQRIDVAGSQAEIKRPEAWRQRQHGEDNGDQEYPIAAHSHALHFELILRGRAAKSASIQPMTASRRVGEKNRNPLTKSSNNLSIHIIEMS